MKKILIYTLISFLFIGCKKFDQSNINQNAPENVNPQFLLSNVLSEGSNNQAYWGWHAGSLLAQHTSNLEFLPVDRYNLGSNEGLWTATYRLMKDLTDIKNSEQGNDAYSAVADILIAHQASLLTDLWTNVPYFEALKGQSEGNFTPAFDTQESIYTGEGGILDLLEKSVNTLQSTTDNIDGDIMYQGNLTKWIAFANGLRIRYLLRISNQVNVSTEMQAIVDEGLLFQSLFDEAVVPYLSASPNQWVIFTEREGRYVDVRMSKTAEDIITPFNDPRIAHYYKPTANSTPGSEEYNGIPNGLSRQSQLSFNLSDVSLLGSYLRDEPDAVKAAFMTFSELQFCLAEAAHKGLISGSSTIYYENGIRASFNHLGVDIPSGYLSQMNVLLSSGDELEKIMTQKWISSFMNGYEAWFDYRRTGFPTLTIPQDNLNNDVYPVRYAYPSTEQAVNGSNYSQAVGAIGGDTYNSKGWWEQ
ncbi:SusD/RagB family nutrient-binding outer membrane lipoprotein [Brumimicrobium mesophilum]|uniref:SusD/RagB family nutrient-binding outer membrane lipoprotein n=1 Tax=Brumimicrobium mesophilum TaxID=392717 RepID=UPI000D13ED9C|nr:SusD/RagB family nutrient-binding outer membrane lipoprotein [Brumimicrobium mesophilum]